MLAKDFVASAFKPGDHGTTFGGNPLSTRAGIAVLETMEEEKLCENSCNIGAYIKQRIENELADVVKEVRGMGLMIGVEFKEPIGKAVAAKLCDNKYLVGSIGDCILRIVPPLIITKSDLIGTGTV